MRWFELTGDERITQRCATARCGGQPTLRLESGGTGSNYCSGCAVQIARMEYRARESNREIDELEKIFGIDQLSS